MVAKKTVLLVEDNDDDIVFIEKAVSRYNLDFDLIIVRNGKDALNMIYGSGNYSKEDIPEIVLIILDINLPKINGLDVLKKIRDDGIKNTLPIVMLSSSQNESDIIKAGEYGANSYIKKPITFQEFQNTIHLIISYWLNTDKLTST